MAVMFAAVCGGVVTLRAATLPTVTITNPVGCNAYCAAGYVKANDTVTLAATAVPGDAPGSGPVQYVEFVVYQWVGGTNGNYTKLVLGCTDDTAPYTCDWDVPKGAGKYFAIMAYAESFQGVDGDGNPVPAVTPSEWVYVSSVK